MLEISAQFPRKSPLGLPYPRVFKATCIEDMVTSRQEEIANISTSFFRPLPVETSISGRARPIFYERFTAVVLIPKVQHYPVFDLTREQILEQYGVKMNPNLLMRVSDFSGELDVGCTRSTNAFYPYTTSFYDKSRRFNENNWLAYKDEAWKTPSLILAQYRRKNSSSPIIDRYWLINVYNYGVKRTKEQTDPILKLIPSLNPG